MACTFTFTGMCTKTDTKLNRYYVYLLSDSVIIS